MRSPEYTLTLMGCLVVTITGGLVFAAMEGRGPGELPPLVGRLPSGVYGGTANGLLPPSFAGRDDQLLASPMLRHPRFRAEVQRWIRFWETKPRRWVPTYLERMTWFEDHVDAVLARHRLPWSLRFLPVLESGYSPSAVSSARAVGLWQFMAATAGDFDLELTRTLDERRDPFKSTEAAADYLVDLHREFGGSWFLALAAYNAGPERIRGILARHAPGAPLSDSLYWSVRRYLPRETREFVPKLFGAMVVAGDPEAHGYGKPSPRPFVFDRILVPGDTRLAAVAQVAGVSRAEITRLNPEYHRGVTPGDRRAFVRVPAGTAELFRSGSGAARRGDGSER